VPGTRRRSIGTARVSSRTAARYDEILSMSPINYMSQESFKMLARRAGEDLRVRISWPKR